MENLEDQIPRNQAHYQRKAVVWEERGLKRKFGGHGIVSHSCWPQTSQPLRARPRSQCLRGFSATLTAS